MTTTNKEHTMTTTTNDTRAELARQLYTQLGALAREIDGHINQLVSAVEGTDDAWTIDLDVLVEGWGMSPAEWATCLAMTIEEQAEAITATALALDGLEDA